MCWSRNKAVVYTVGAAGALTSQGSKAKNIFVSPAAAEIKLLLQRARRSLGQNIPFVTHSPIKLFLIEYSFIWAAVYCAPWYKEEKITSS